MTTPAPLVSVLMGSKSDWQGVMDQCAATLDTLEIPHEVRVLSAHRAPAALHEYVTTAESRGVRVFIAAAGGAAHLAGVVASLTTRPVLAVPIKAWSLEGLDSLLSMVQMPKGIPVGTLAIGKPGAINAAILAAQILGTGDEGIAARVKAHRDKQSAEALASTYPRG